MLKKTKKLPFAQLAALLIIAGFALIMGACPIDAPPENRRPNKEESANFNIYHEPEQDTKIFGPEIEVTYDGKAKAVIVTHKTTNLAVPEKDVYYKERSSEADKVDRGPRPPTDAGTYDVTFDVAGETLDACTLVIKPAVPAVGDFNITGYSAIFNGRSHELSILASPESPGVGAVTAVYYEGTDGTFYPKNTAGPVSPGTYTVTFDVAAAKNYTAAGLTAPNPLVIAPVQGPVAQTPYLYHFTVLPDLSEAYRYDGNPKPVSVLPADPSYSQGKITIYYERQGITTATPPVNVGRYTVTFHVAEADGWKAETLRAGILNIVVGTPVEDDFNIWGRYPTADGTPKAVRIWPKENKSRGTITTYYAGTEGTVYAYSTNPPSAIGRYAVTFNVAAVMAEGWNEAYDLSAGTLIIREPSPVAGDFDYDGLTATADGQRKTVTITPQAGKSQGAITVWYAGTDGTTYARSTSGPRRVGSYAVTFDVAAATGFGPATGLPAGTLVISPAAPVADDYDYSGLTATYDGSAKAVTITPKEGSSRGRRTIYYDDSTERPSATGSYIVTFDVAAWRGFAEAKGLVAPEPLVIQDPVNPEADHFILVGAVNGVVKVYHDGTAKTVTIEPRPGKSEGDITIWYEDTATSTRTTDGPSAIGTYNVTFDVAEAPGFNATSESLFAGQIVIEAQGEWKNYLPGGDDALNWGIESQASVSYLGLTPGKTTSEVNLNWYSSRTTTDNNVAHVRFVEGTFREGRNLITVTNGRVSTGGTNNTTRESFNAHKVEVGTSTETELKAGVSYQYAVSSDGTNWSKTYDYRVPAAGPFTFAVVGDPQIPTTATMYAINATNWQATMAKIAGTEASFVVSGGDTIEDTGGNETQYEYFFSPAQLRNIPFAPVPGNHDISAQYDYHFNWPVRPSSPLYPTGRNYYYLYNNILFVALDSGTSSSTTTIVDRFDAIIGEAKTAYYGRYDWLIVHHHRSTGSPGTHSGTNTQEYVRDGFEAVMNKHGVDFAIGGHDHVYARTFPMLGREKKPDNVPAQGWVPGSGRPDTSFKRAPGSVWTNIPEKHTIYFTFPSGSGWKNGDNMYTTSNNKDHHVAYARPAVPGYTIVTVNGRTIKFEVFATRTANPTFALSGGHHNVITDIPDEDTPYDVLTVTK